MLNEDQVREELKKVIDPELFVNIVDLGLIYVVDIRDAEEDGKKDVFIDMTMTSPACPAGPQLIANSKTVVSQMESVGNVEVKIVMDPPWTPDLMTEDARDQLGIFQPAGNKSRRMKVFIYEFITGGGYFHVEDAPPTGSLLCEGQAMLSAIVADFERLSHVRVVTMRDARLGTFPHSVKVASARQERDVFERLARDCHALLLIAPEFDHHLYARALNAEKWGCTLLSPSAEFCAIAGNKSACCQRLSRFGVQVPRGQFINQGESFPSDLRYPLVLKPNDGAGSQGVRRVESMAGEMPSGLRVEEYISGQACSIGWLCCGSSVPLNLPPMHQVLTSDGRFGYRGGRRIMDAALAQRAVELSRRALLAMPVCCGIVGMDMVLGSARDGSHDYLIELNPRLTTSYVAQRRLAKENLAAAMIEAAQQRTPQLNWHDQAIEFLADGTVV